MGTLSNVEKVKGSVFKGKVMIIEHAELETRAGKKYTRGKFVDTEGTEASLVKWDRVGFDEMPQSFEAVITAKYDDYNGNISYVVSDMEGFNTQVDKLAWLPKVITQQEAVQRLQNLLNTEVSAKGRQLFNKAFKFEAFGGGRRLLTEPAAVKHHDSGIGGLINHTLKVTEIAALLTHQHPQFFRDQDLKDIFLLGCLLHDWGKLITHNVEDKENPMSHRSFLDHRYLFMEFLLQEEPEFLKEMETLYSERHKDEFISIVMQHHGVYEERPRTMTVYLVSWIDLIEANITAALEGAAQGKAFASLSDGSKRHLDLALYKVQEETEEQLEEVEI